MCQKVDYPKSASIFCPQDEDLPQVEQSVSSSTCETESDCEPSER